MPYVLSTALVLILGEHRQTHIRLRDLCTPPPTNPTTLSASPGCVDQSRRSSACTGGAQARLPQVASGSPGRGCRGVLSDLFANWCLDYELVVCSCRLCCFSFALYPPAQEASALKCSRNPSRKVGKPSQNI